MKKLNIKYIGIIAIIAFSSFLIGNTSKLYIDNGVDYAVLNMENPPGDHPFLSTRVNSEDGLGMFLESIGRLIIGTNDACLLTFSDDTIKLVVNGDAWKTGDPFLYGESDSRLKENIEPLERSRDKFMNTKIYSYRYKESGKMRYGIMAQEVKDDFPHSVSAFEKNGEEYLAFNPNNLFFTGMKVIQENSKEIVEQQEYIRKLDAALATERDRNDQQQNEINAIKSALSKHGIKIPISVSEDDTKAESPVTTYKRIANQNDTPKLHQNIPNPARLSTYIPYRLPQNTQQAALIIQNMAGTMIAEYTLPTHQGEGKIDIDLTRFNLKSGTYTYTLKVNNRLVDTKKMVLSATK